MPTADGKLKRTLHCGHFNYFYYNFGIMEDLSTVILTILALLIAGVPVGFVLRRRTGLVLQDPEPASELVATAEKIRTTEDLQRVFDAVTQVEANDLQELADRIDDWRDVYDDAGEPQAFSAERLAACLDYQWFFQAAREALFRASREGVAKN